MRWILVNCLLLAGLAAAMPEPRTKRDLSYIKNLIATNLFGADTIFVQQPKMSKNETYRIYKIKGYNNILLKITKKPENKTLVSEKPDPVIVKPDIAIIGSYLGTTTESETLLAIEMVKSLLNSGILNGIRDQRLKEVIVKESIKPVSVSPAGQPIVITEEVIRPVQSKYSYQHKGENADMTYESYDSKDVIVTRTEKEPPLPELIKLRIANVASLDANQYVIRPPTQIGTVLKETPQLIRIGPGLYTPIPPPNLVETIAMVPRPFSNKEGSSNVITEEVKVTPVQTQYSYQHKGENADMTYESYNSKDVIVTRTEKEPPLPEFIKVRIANVAPLNTKPYVIRPPTQIGTVLKETPQPFTIGPGLYPSIPPPNLVESIAMVPRPFPNKEGPSNVITEEVKVTPVQTQYSYQHKGENTDMTYESYNSKDVIVTRTEKDPPLPEFIKVKIANVAPLNTNPYVIRPPTQIGTVLKETPQPFRIGPGLYPSIPPPNLVETIAMVPRPFPNNEGPPIVITEEVKATPVQTKYSYQQKNDNADMTYKSHDNKNVVVTKTQKEPPLPEFIKVRIANVASLGANPYVLSLQNQISTGLKEPVKTSPGLYPPTPPPNLVETIAMIPRPFSNTEVAKGEKQTENTKGEPNKEQHNRNTDNVATALKASEENQHKHDGQDNIDKDADNLKEVVKNAVVDGLIVSKYSYKQMNTNSNDNFTVVSIEDPSIADSKATIKYVDYNGEIPKDYLYIPPKNIDMLPPNAIPMTNNINEVNEHLPKESSRYVQDKLKTSITEKLDTERSTSLPTESIELSELNSLKTNPLVVSEDNSVILKQNRVRKYKGGTKRQRPYDGGPVF